MKPRRSAACRQPEGLRSCGEDPGGVMRARFARRRSGQLRRMVDRGGRRGRCFEPLRNKWLHRDANSQDKNSASQSRGVIVRRAAVLMLRPRVAVVTVVAVVAVAVVVMNMRHAVAVCRNLPMFVGMHALRGGQHNEADQPERKKPSATEHKLQATFESFGVKQVHVRRAALTHSGVLIEDPCQKNGRPEGRPS